MLCNLMFEPNQNIINPKYESKLDLISYHKYTYLLSRSSRIPIFQL